jgi:hypothetical protein
MKISLSEKLDRIVRQKAREVSSYLSTGSTDIDSLVILVMTQVAKDADEDLRLLLEEVKSVNAAKRQLRQIVCQVRRDISDNLGGRGGKRRLTFSNGMTSEGAYHRMPLPVPDCSCAGGVKLISTDLHKGRIDDVAQLEAIRENLQAKLDGMDEMSEMTSLRLQMMMDRRSKFIATLSNIMKKISETQNALVQNLK